MKAATKFASLFAVAACGFVLLPGCLIHSSQNVHYSGLSPVSAATQSVQVGKSTRDDVIGALGRPNEQEPLDNGDEVWRWNYTKHQHDHARVFLLLNSRTNKHTPGTFSVTFRDGVVLSKRWM